MTSLEGVRVLELGGWVAGPLTGMLLADHGAEVVRVLAPGVGLSAGPEAALYNRGKAQVHLDLHDPRHLDLATELAMGADVLVDNHRPGALSRLGLDAEALRARNPALITVTIPAWSPGHPLAGRPGWEGSLGAEAGLHTHPAERSPRYVPIPAASVLGALYAALGITAALLARERDGHGQHVTVPLLDTLLSAQAVRGMLSVSPPRTWRSLQWAASPLLGTWRTQKGGHVYLHLGQPHHLHRFLEVLEESGMAEEASAWRARLHPHTLTDPMSIHSVREAAWIKRRLEELMATRTAREWEDLLGGAGLSTARCRSTEAWLAHPQPRSTGEVVDVDHPRHGPLTQPGVHARLSLSPGRVGAPTTALDPSELEGRWDPRPTPQGPRDPRPPLADLTVLDLGQIIAGPLAGRTLAELGARVVQVCKPGPQPPWLQAMAVAYDAGKERVVLDLARHGGSEALLGLVARLRPDVVVENWRRGVAERLGLSESRLREASPALVYTSISAWGRAGPWGDRPGWEQTTQAATGVEVRYGADGRPELLPLAATDVGTGLGAVLGTLLSLLHRQRTGQGQRVEVSLSSTALLLQAPLLYRYQRADRLGSRTLHRLVRLSDGWAFMAAPPNVVNELWRVRELRGVDDAPDRPGFLADRLARHDLATWAQRLREAGLERQVELRPVRSLRDVLLDPVHADLVRLRHHPDLGRVLEVGSPLRLSGTPLLWPHATARPGDHNHLLELPSPPQLPAPRTRPDRIERAAWWWQQARWGALLLWRKR